MSGGADLRSVVCPSITLCVATDAGGNVLTSTNPAGGASAWTPAHIDGNDGYECVHYGETGCPVQLGAVSCASVMSCTALDNAGYMFTSTDPAGGTAAWRQQGSGPVPGSEALSSLSCPTAALCVAGAFYDPNVVTFGTAVAGGRSRVALGADSLGVAGTWCAAGALCFAELSGLSPAERPIARLYVSMHPNGPVAAWKVSYVAPETVDAPAITSLSCPSRSLCYAAVGPGSLIVGRPAPTTAQIKSSLTSDLRPKGIGARITQLRDHGGYQFQAFALEAGRLQISWSARAVQGQAPHRRTVHQVMATASAVFSRPSEQDLRLRLNRAGQRLVKNTSRLPMIATARFTPLDGRSVTATKAITLRR